MPGSSSFARIGLKYCTGLSIPPASSRAFYSSRFVAASDPGEHRTPWPCMGCAPFAERCHVHRG
eukprot:1883849-Lingulodinium_polyedra.AAC.1